VKRLAAVTVELRRHCYDRVVGGLAAQVVELGPADLRVEVAAPVCLGVRGPQNEVVQPLQRTCVRDAGRPQTVDPRP